MTIANPFRRVMDRFGAGSIFLGVGLLLFLVLGSVAAGLAAASIQRANWPTAEGVVTGSDIKSGSSTSSGTQSTTVYPRVSFLVDGKRYDFTSKIGGNALEKGSRVTVQYKADDPSHAEIKGRGAWVPILLGSMGAGFLIIFGLPGFIVVKVHLARLSDSPPTGVWATRIWPALRDGVGIVPLVFYALAVGAIIPLGILSAVTFHSDHERSAWPTAEGTVVQLVKSKSYDDPDHQTGRYTYVYTPILQYTVDGKKYSIIPNSSSSVPTMQVGDTATVYYEPGDPSNGVLNAGHSFVPYLLGGIGLGAFLIFGFAGWRISRG